MPNIKAAIEADTQFYRKNYRRLLKVTFILLVIGYLFDAGALYQHLLRPVPKYFATTSDGRLIEIQAITAPAP